MHLMFVVAAIILLAGCAYFCLFAVALLREYGPLPMNILLFVPDGLMTYVVLCSLGALPITLVTRIAALSFMVVIPLAGVWFIARVWRPYYSEMEEEIKKSQDWQGPSLLWQMTATAITLTVTVSVVLTCVKVLFLN